jgi:hypothetical protein
LVFQLNTSGKIERDSWMSIGTKRRDWREWCTKRRQVYNEIGKGKCPIVVEVDGEEWIVFR